MLNHNICQKEVCKRLYISETAFRNLYIKHFGITPKQYMLNIQLCKAKTLLRTTDLHITEIAEKLNYISASKFNIIFKKHYGLTPCEYRKITTVLEN
ncbi:MAG: AraC family transcriptional regulator [Clostridia bacterium]